MAKRPLHWEQLSAPLQQYAEQQWLKLLDRYDETQVTPYKEQLLTAFAFSDFLFDTLFHDPQNGLLWLQSSSLNENLSREYIHLQILNAVEGVNSEPALMAALRKARKQLQFMIIWRDLLGMASLDEVLEATSALADEIILIAKDWLYSDLESRWGTPTDGDGNPQPMLVIGMGKLGGCELNVSSDVDLIFCYPEGGTTRGVRRERDNQEFFIRLGQRLIYVLNQATADGSVFRVDMRLRPFGDSGPLVMPFSAIEDYYQHHGREWERYAMVKARVLGSADEHVATLVGMLMPFVFRRYIDFSAYQSLRQMKLLIQQEERRRQLTTNIKLGAGGIREIEFIAQAQQLIRGGREPLLRGRNLLDTLQSIAELKCIPSADIESLSMSYRYLRKLEHALQGVSDAQTQTLPENEMEQSRVAAIMGHDAWHQLMNELDQYRSAVHRCFELFIGEQVGEQEESSDKLKTMPLWPDVWQDELMDDACSEAGISEVKQFLLPLKKFYDLTHKRQVGPRGRDALARLMPPLLTLIVETESPEKSLGAVLGVLDPILTRTTYIELLLESPKAMQQLVRLCTASSWIAAELARHPMLLDELLEPAQLYKPTEMDAYEDELRQFMLRVPDDDLEQQMEALRHFKQIQQLRIAAADISGVLPVMKVSDHLTHLAEVLVAFCLRAAWLQLSERFGTPDGVNSVDECVSVLGYGKLGGIELGYGSDLDIVFFHMAPQGATNGARSIDNIQFLVKMVQRFSHLMTTKTHSGELYEIDLRLRPSGASGLLITHLNTLASYQKEEAWVWEHQALVRARAIFGSKDLECAFEKLRNEVICLPREQKALATEVVRMRHKMREHLGSKESDAFDLKQDPGGIADIEFIAQFLVLCHGRNHPTLTQWSDNVRIFEAAAELGLLTEQQQQHLTQAYCNYRNKGHHLALQCRKAKVQITEFIDERKQVVAVWQSLFAGVEQCLVSGSS